MELDSDFFISLEIFVSDELEIRTFVLFGTNWLSSLVSATLNADVDQDLNPIVFFPSVYSVIYMTPAPIINMSAHLRRDSRMNAAG